MPLEKQEYKLPNKPSQLTPNQMNRLLMKITENDLLDMVSLSLLSENNIPIITAFLDKKNLNNEKKHGVSNHKNRNGQTDFKKVKQQIKPRNSSKNDIKASSAAVQDFQEESKPVERSEKNNSKKFDYNDQVFHHEK